MPELIWDSVHTIFRLIAAYLADEEHGFGLMVLVIASRPFVEFAHRYI